VWGGGQWGVSLVLLLVLITYGQALSWFYAFLSGGSDYYMVGISAVCWEIWKTRNKVTFEKHKMRTPCEIMFLASSFLMYWAGL
jgi:hypothetical protein